MTAAEELLDVVDADDRVLYQASRAEIHAGSLLHRAVHIFVFNPRREFLLHRRSAVKDQFPLCYTSSASGHLDVGEDYDAAAVRELQEELGLCGVLEPLTKLPASPETAYEHTMLYRMTTADTPQPHPEEIDEVRWITLEQWRDLCERQPEALSPPFARLSEWYLSRYLRL